MLFSGINPRSPSPLYAQIAESVRRAIEEGEVAPGDLLPSVRSLATRLRVNPSTVSHAYRELVRDGLATADGEGSQQVLRIARPGSNTPRPHALADSAKARGAAGAPSRLEPGETLEERFQIKRLLGAGAMGAVYLARDLELDEDVALKILPPLNTDDESAVRRFVNEIRVARRVSHRNVVRTHDVGRWAGGLFLTMEFVAGRTLRAALDGRGTIPAAEVIEIGAQLADALAVAHAEGVIHRDVKPQNLIIDATGTLKVLDFGIAVLEGTTGQLTEAGLVVGTPAYMSPEQLMGEPLRPAADLYATGVVLYECLSGRLPFTATSPMALVAQIVQRGPHPLAEAAPAAPPALAALVMQLLQREPDRRLPSAAALATALRALA